MNLNFNAMVMNSDDFKAASFDRLAQKAIDVCLKDGCHYPTMAIVGTKHTSFSFFQKLPGTASERVQLAFTAGMAVGGVADGDLGEILRVVFVDEAYLTEVPFKTMDDGLKPLVMDALKAGNFTRLTELVGRECRKEVLLIAGLEADGTTQRFASYDFIRDGSRKLSDLVATQHIMYDRDDTRANDGNNAAMPLLIALAAGYRRGLALRGPQELRDGS